MRLSLVCVVVSLAVSWTPAAIGRPQPGPGDRPKGEDAIGFEVFAGFKRIEKGNPIFALDPPLWAAATHAIVVDETAHYFWCGRQRGARWLLLMHATAPVGNLTDITQDARNPILVPSEKGFDDAAVEYPFAFLNPADDGKVWRIGHVRTRDFRTFEPNPHNPIFTPSASRDAWDCGGVLTPHVIEIGDTYYMVYAGKKGKEWQTGLAKTPKP